MARTSLTPAPSSRGVLLLAIAVYVVIKMFVPFGRQILYPLTILNTWVHEMGHGVSALLVGGSFQHLDVFADGSGLAYTTTAPDHPIARGITAAGGLLAPPILGAVLLAVSRGPRRARTVLALFALAIVVSLVMCVRSIAGWIVLPLDAAVLLYFAFEKNLRARMVFAQFVGFTLAINTIGGIDYLFTATAMVDGEKRASDIATVAASFGGFYLVWGTGIALVSLALVLVGLLAAWRDHGVTR